jgi:cytochrome c peroxidase
LHLHCYYYVLILVLTGLFLQKCKPDIGVTANGADLTGIPYTPQAYTIAVPQGFPQIIDPIDNPLTKDGVNLGRYLFYDKRLSKNLTMSCASCHLPQKGFSDPNRLSVGVDGLTTSRQAMSIQNLAFAQTEYFWDGRATSLEAQAILPVENVVELHETWQNVERKIRADTMYQRLFRKAFGIQNSGQITKALATRAIAQFERTIVVGGNSRYYKVFVRGQGVPTDDEVAGYQYFFNVNQTDAQCFHCHNEPLFKGNNFENNGLDAAANLNDFADKGRGAITNKLNDNGKFRAPTLWNIALTAPYMHDGRFQTLEQVIDHYNSHGKYANNVNIFISQVGSPTFTPGVVTPLTNSQKAELLSFLYTLTDTISLQKPELQNPF